MGRRTASVQWRVASVLHEDRAPSALVVEKDNRSKPRIREFAIRTEGLFRSKGIFIFFTKLKNQRLQIQQRLITWTRRGVKEHLLFFSTFHFSVFLPGPSYDQPDLSALTTDAAGKLDVLGHDGDPLGVNRAQVGVLKEPDEVGLRRLLEREHGGALEPEIGLEVLGNLPHEALERQLADEELGRLLVATDLTERDGTGAVAMGLLDAAGGGRGLAGGLGGEVLAGRLASGRLTGSLLGTGH
mmetsp:Transcript_10853/g.27292  ORF Transcript_10853/g.27292 Transcript_10853/m.27292 type:complete len:242 (+) Transcript_10853:561-1286(+)